ncbi:MAG: flagellar basal body rod modification protein [bacterium ADurb.Bin478]|nr:MAG: flagellar basal body rod modification protein [bacterium ADurb.Bin478]
MKTQVIVLLLVVCLAGGLNAGDKLYQERLYEPKVLWGDKLAAFYGYPVNEIYLYAWDEAQQSWRMMPFQIDERIRTNNPFNEENLRHFYSIPNDYGVALDDGLFDSDDELVFLVRDMGDRAPEKKWLDNASSKAFSRIELAAGDPEDPSRIAYAYLFRSPTIQEPVPTPYGFVYHSQTDSIETSFYTVKLDEAMGLVKSITIKPPYGTGVDVFDRQKMRVKARLGFGTLGDVQIDATEELIKLLPEYRMITPKPVVRLVREVRVTFQFGEEEVENNLAFFLTTKFYPFNGVVKGGSALDEASLRQAMPGWDNPFLLFEVLRQSWDLSAAAAGMRYYSKHNDGISIDGQPDVVNQQIDRPIREWNLVTGSQGALFTMTTLPDTVAKSISLYFYDNQAGGTGDPDTLGFVDTGEYGSYGDFGLSMYKAKSLDLAFEMYFLPNTVNTAEQASAIARMVEKPVDITPLVTDVARRPAMVSPESYLCVQNYPNPFNQQTLISFSLASAEQVQVTIYDSQGRLIRTLVQATLAAGNHELRWDGCDGRNRVLASGVYFYQLTAGDQIARNKLLLLR